jgi:hypothetical protein
MGAKRGGAQNKIDQVGQVAQNKGNHDRAGGTRDLAVGGWSLCGHKGKLYQFRLGVFNFRFLIGDRSRIGNLSWG